MSRAERMNGICLIWTRGRLISPSLPVGDDRYLNLSSQKRPTGRNLRGNRLVRRSGSTFRGTVVLVLCLCMRRRPLTLVLTRYSWEWHELLRVKWIHDSVTSFTNSSFLNMLIKTLSLLMRTFFENRSFRSHLALLHIFFNSPKITFSQFSSSFLHKYTLGWL